MMRNGMEALRFDFEGNIFGFGRDLYERCCWSCVGSLGCATLVACSVPSWRTGGLGNRKASMLIYMGIVFPIENAIIFIKI
jgi:hypothetical protein